MKPTDFIAECAVEMPFTQGAAGDFSPDSKLAFDLGKIMKKSVDLAIPELFAEARKAKQEGGISDSHMCIRMTLALGNVEAFKEDEDEED